MFRSWRIKRILKRAETRGNSIENGLKNVDEFIDVLINKLTPELKKDPDVQLFMQTMQELRNCFIEDFHEDNEKIKALKMKRKASLENTDIIQAIVNTSPLNIQARKFKVMERQARREQIYRNFDQAYRKVKPKLDAIF